MRKSVANKIKELVSNECKRQQIPFAKYMYRRAKSVYYEIPWNKRHLVGTQNG